MPKVHTPTAARPSIAQHGSGMPVPDWAQMGLTVFGPGELNHVAPKLRMDSRDIRFPFGHSRPCQLTPLLACASSKTSAPLHGRGFLGINRVNSLWGQKPRRSESAYSERFAPAA